MIERGITWRIGDRVRHVFSHERAEWATGTITEVIGDESVIVEWDGYSNNPKLHSKDYLVPDPADPATVARWLSQ